MNYAKPIEDLIYELSRLPGIGRKSAQRMAFHILNMEEKKVGDLVKALSMAKKSIHPCSMCHSLTDHDVCSICSDEDRDSSLLCVVEDTRELVSIEATGAFHGYYFVLGGLLSPIKQIGPEEIHIPKLQKTIQERKVKEIIVAVSPTMEGEATALLIAGLVEGTDIQVTQLAQGIALGSSLEYYDAFTLSRALSERRSIR